MLEQFGEIYTISYSDLEPLEDKAMQLVNMRVKPHISLDEAAAVVIGVLIRYFSEGLEQQRKFRQFLWQKYNLDKDQIKRKTQEYRERLNKKKIFQKLGLKN